MKTKKKLGILSATLAALLFVNCTRVIYEPIMRSQTVIDTLTQTVTDSAVLRALFECDSLGNVRLKSCTTPKAKWLT